MIAHIYDWLDWQDGTIDIRVDAEMLKEIQKIIEEEIRDLILADEYEKAEVKMEMRKAIIEKIEDYYNVERETANDD